jgi:hypothetical protein
MDEVSNGYNVHYVPPSEEIEINDLPPPDEFVRPL